MRRKPSSSSSSFIRLLTTDGRVRSSAAALVKLRRWATRTKVLSLFRSRNAAVNDIVHAPRDSRTTVVPRSDLPPLAARFYTAPVRPDGGPDTKLQNGTAMLKEYHYDHLIRWPNNERATVFLTFDFQGGEDV